MRASARAWATISPGWPPTGASDFETYDDAWRWSVDEPGAFWQSVWDHFGVRSERPPGPALADPRMPGARWFPGALMNYAEQALSMPGRSPDDVMIVARSQTREPSS